jgi:8-amino-7-oxononanoate synthase
MKKNQLDLLDESRLFNLPASSWSGREFVSNGKTHVDFANTNYLGFDFDPYVHEKGTRLFQEWGSIAGWSRMEVDPRPYPELEERIARFLGAPEVHLSHTITITNFSTIPVIAQKGVIFADQLVHTVVWEAGRLARDHGAELHKFRHQDLNHLEDLLKANRNKGPKIIAVDGVYSISTEVAPIAAMQDLCERYDAWLYIDDAHGFGLLGRDPSEENPYGTGGNGVVNHAARDFRRTFYVSSFGKAFCTYTAFVTIPEEYEHNLKAYSMQYLFSAPPLPYVIGTVDAMLDLNEQRGDAARATLRARTRQLVQGLRALGYKVSNHLDQPVVFVEIGTLERLMEASRFLWDAGVVAGLRAFPVVPEDKCGLRFALSALHTEAHVAHALTAFADLKKRAVAVAA